MSDEAIGFDEFGWGEETQAAALPAGDYTGTIKVASWGTKEWVSRKYPDQNPTGKVLNVKVEIDAPAGYAEVWRAVPVHMRYAIVSVCKAAGVEPPVKGGPAWSPATLLGREVRVSTSIYTNEQTGESKVQIDKWLPRPATTAVDEPPAAKPARKAAAAKATSPDDIPF